jgi:hypothetical protein
LFAARGRKDREKERKRKERKGLCFSSAHFE